jgi:hypothetical protein
MHATGLEAPSVLPCVHLDEPLLASAVPLVTRSVAGGAATELGRIPARSSHVSRPIEVVLRYEQILHTLQTALDGEKKYTAELNATMGRGSKIR